MTGRRVLVVDDEGLIAADIAGRLESLGYTVIGTAGAHCRASSSYRRCRPSDLRTMRRA